MASPRVFISSTCYDLKHIRESLKYFVKGIGYEPVLSDEGDVFYNPQAHTHDSCLDEVATCQLFVLIIGGRYGGIHKDSSESITNEEYRTAVLNNIPIFTLVDQSVSSDHHLYQMNGKNEYIDRDKVTYPASDNVKIFHFINEVRKKSVNNAIQPFRNFLDIETYLKKQWAGMLFDFLLKAKNEEQLSITNKLLSDLSIASKKTEELVKFVYEKVNDVNAQEIIENVSSKVDAKIFIDHVYKLLGNTKLDSKSIEELMSVNMGDYWADYLVKCASFRITEEYDNDNHQVDTVLWSPNTSYGTVIDSTGSFKGDSKSLYEKGFKALKSLNDTDKKDVLMTLVS